MSVFDFEADLIIHDGGVDLKFAANAVGQGLRVARFEQNDVASDLASERLGSCLLYTSPPPPWSSGIIGLAGFFAPVFEE